MLSQGRDPLFVVQSGSGAPHSQSQVEPSRYHSGSQYQSSGSPAGRRSPQSSPQLGHSLASQSSSPQTGAAQSATQLVASSVTGEQTPSPQRGAIAHSRSLGHFAAQSAWTTRVMYVADSPEALASKSVRTARHVPRSTKSDVPLAKMPTSWLAESYTPEPELPLNVSLVNVK
jgi:hypothetical protein